MNSTDIKNAIAEQNKIRVKAADSTNELLTQYVAAKCDELRASIVERLVGGAEMFDPCVEVIHSLLAGLRFVEIHDANVVPMILCIDTGVSGKGYDLSCPFRTAFPALKNFSLNDKLIQALIAYVTLTENDFLEDGDDVDPYYFDTAVRQIDQISSGEFTDPEIDDEDVDDEEEDIDDYLDDDEEDGLLPIINQYGMSELFPHLSNHRILLVQDMYNNHYNWNFVLLRDNLPLSVLESIPVTQDV